MVAAHLESSQIQASLIEVIVPNGDVKRYQNYQEETYFYQDNPYEFLPIEGGLSSTRSIGLGDSGQSVKISNLDARSDALRPVRDWLRAQDGWRRAEVITTQIWPSDLSHPPIIDRFQILSASIDGPAITFALKDAADATNASIPSFHLTPKVAPELPFSAPGRL